MLVTTHLLTGAAIGHAIPNPVIVAPLAFASHFVMDALPHWPKVVPEKRLPRKIYMVVAIDLLISTVILGWLSFSGVMSDVMWLGALAASLPDLDAIFYNGPLVGKVRSLLGKWFHFHGKIQNETNSWWGFLPQFVIALVGLVVIVITS